LTTFFTTDDVYFSSYDVVDPDINFSDHLPIKIVYTVDDKVLSSKQSKHNHEANDDVIQLRWDYADVMSYYHYNGAHLQPIFTDVINLANNTLECNDVRLCIDMIYARVVRVLRDGANMFIPARKKSFLKFWWDESLSLLKQESVDTAKVWKAAGKPRSGAIFQKYQAARTAYRSSLREHQKLKCTSYTNDLHIALSSKNAKEFWNCWRSKFEQRAKYEQVDGCVDKSKIAEKFALHFSGACSSNNSMHAADLKQQYEEKRAAYYGTPLDPNDKFDVELVDKIISELQRGKAAGLDSLTAEHLQYSHPILRSILTTLFNVMLVNGCVPVSFGCSYTVPLIKGDGHARALTCNDFRGISISPVISKVFEHCVLQRYKQFLGTSDNQFGFKPGLGCSHAINTVRSVIDRHIKGGSTVNICALDLSKAFDKMNHHALFIKLMKRNIPIEILCVLELWFSSCYTCVKWHGVRSAFYQINIGIRQGGVLSPILFAVYLDDVVNIVCRHRYGSTLSIVLYADDIILISPSVQALQILLTICETELLQLDMLLNAKKSCCMRIGERCNAVCADILTLSGDKLPWVDEIRYLGVYIVKFRHFKCSLDNAKKSFYRAANAIFGKIGRVASEEVTLDLIKKKCLPVLVYGLEACVLNITEQRSLNYPCKRFLMKLFCTCDETVLHDVELYFNFRKPSEIVIGKKETFLKMYACSENLLCRLCVPC